jgi:hypothetical protein
MSFRDFLPHSFDSLYDIWEWVITLFIPNSKKVI